MDREPLHGLGNRPVGNPAPRSEGNVLCDTTADVFVQHRNMDGDILMFLVHPRDNTVCLFCGCAGDVIRYTFPELQQVLRDIREPIHAKALCESCDTLVETAQIDTLAEFCLNGYARRFVNQPSRARNVAADFVHELRGYRRVEITWQKNDVRLGYATGVAPGSLGVSGRRNGELCDAHAWLESTGPSPAQIYTDYRNSYRSRYGYAIPTKEALDLITIHAPNGLIDYGAGNGYWAYLLQQRGLDVVAIDKRTLGLGNPYFSPDMDKGFAPFSWTTIDIGDERLIKRQSPKRALFISWPPPNDSMALHALQTYNGETFTFAGVPSSDVCASDGFFDTLKKSWQPVETVKLPSFYGIEDCLTVYRRNHA